MAAAAFCACRAERTRGAGLNRSANSHSSLLPPPPPSSNPAETWRVPGMRTRRPLDRAPAGVPPPSSPPHHTSAPSASGATSGGGHASSASSIAAAGMRG
eukprot:323911-Chlamydomonas_euryale.AAC.1